MKYLLSLALCCSVFHTASAKTWLVGPTRTYTKPSQVSTLAQNGDTVLIDAGLYAADVARWGASNLLIRGVGGLAHLKSGGSVYGGKAIWVIAGNDVTVEYIEFSEATCQDHNGAGIRSEGIDLTLRYCYFHHNEDGILAGDIASGDFLIEHCEFYANGYPDGQAHNLYINHAHSLLFRYNYSHGANVGHELKSRAYHNFIYHNRFSDENGTASRSIDLPNGGFTIIMGNIIVQDPASENSNIIGFGLEGVSNPNSALYLAYNTIVNNKGSGSFVNIANGTPLLKAYDNIFAGPGNKIVGTATTLDTLGNLAGPVSAFGFADPAVYDYHIAAGSIAAGAAVDAGTASINVTLFPLNPVLMYLHPANVENRPNTQDVGAFSVSGASATENPEANPVTVFPNPVRETLLIRGAESATAMQVLDLSGRVWYAGQTRSTFSFEGLPAGIYLVKLLVSDNWKNIPVIRL